MGLFIYYLIHALVYALTSLTHTTLLLHYSVIQVKMNVSLFQQRMAQEVLTHLKEHPDAWTRVDTILEFSQNMNTKVSSDPTYSCGGSWFLYFEEDLISYHTSYKLTIWFLAFSLEPGRLPYVSKTLFYVYWGCLASSQILLCTCEITFSFTLLTFFSRSRKVRVKIDVWGSSVDGEMPQYLHLYSSQMLWWLTVWGQDV